MPDLSITAAGRLSAPDPRQRLHRVAQQFEQQFAARILQPLAEAKDDGPFSNGDPGDAMFKGMLVDGLAEHAAGGLGIARLVEQQLAAHHRQAAAGLQPALRNPSRSDGTGADGGCSPPDRARGVGPSGP